MDERLKTIAENYDKMKIGPDETFRFGCKECGKCCIHREDILLSPNDLFRAAKELGLSVVGFYQQYCEGYIGQDSRIPIIRLLPQGSVRRCPLLKDHHCMIHKAKPSVCAMFPLGRGVALKKDKAPEEQDIKIQYILQPPICGDRSETHTVREWLASFGMEVDDPIFLQWQQFIMTAHDAIAELEKKLPKEEMRRFWNLLTYCAYLNYDTAKDFASQFGENISDARKLISAYQKAVLGVAPNAG